MRAQGAGIAQYRLSGLIVANNIVPNAFQGERI